MNDQSRFASVRLFSRPAARSCLDITPRVLLNSCDNDALDLGLLLQIGRS